MPTYYGKISYTVKRWGDYLKVDIWGDSQSPEGGFVFKSPLTNNITGVEINGSEWREFSDKEVRFYELPVTIVIRYDLQPDVESKGKTYKGGIIYESR